jgi:hypothetical protein
MGAMVLQPVRCSIRTVRVQGVVRRPGRVDQVFPVGVGKPFQFFL